MRLPFSDDSEPNTKQHFNNQPISLEVVTYPTKNHIRRAMNISYPPFHITNIPPPFERLGHEFTKASFYFLIPVEMLYFSIYFHGKGRYRLYEGLSAASVVAFLASPVVAPVKCAAARCLQNLASKLRSFFVEVGRGEVVGS